MKKNLVVIAAAAIFAACNSNPKTVDSTTDTSALNAAADRGQVIELNGVTDTIIGADGVKYVKLDSTTPAQNNVASSATPAVKATRSRPRSTTKTSSSGSGSGSSSNGGSSESGSTVGTGSTAGTETAEAPVAEEKKGWSKAAKGAAIGAGTGAVAGAIISKKKGVGAVIGGVVGGAGGYIIGRKKDKKDGRVQ